MSLGARVRFMTFYGVFTFLMSTSHAVNSLEWMCALEDHLPKEIFEAVSLILTLTQDVIRLNELCFLGGKSRNFF